MGLGAFSSDPKEGVWLYWRERLRIFDIEYKLRGYLCQGEGFEGYFKK